MSRRRTGRHPGWDIVLVVLGAFYPAMHGAYWAIPLTAAAISTAIACWRLVTLTDHQRAQWATYSRGGGHDDR